MPIEEVEYNGLQLSFEPMTFVAPGVPLGLRVKLAPVADEGRVEVELQKNGDPVQRREARPASEEDQTSIFFVELPPFEAGDHVRVRLTGRCNDQRVPGEGDEGASTFEFQVFAPEPFPEATPTATATSLQMLLEQLLPPQEAQRSRQILQALANRGITSGNDLLALDPQTLAGLSARTRERAQRLTAHAALSLAISDTAEREGVIDAGFASLPEIAEMPLAEFRYRLAGSLDQTSTSLPASSLSPVRGRATGRWKMPSGSAGSSLAASFSAMSWRLN